MPKIEFTQLDGQSQNRLLYFFDESRFGTHSNLGHGWFKQGSRTAVKVKLGFKNFYLYSAVEPKTGEDFTYQIPHVSTDWMNLFLQGLSDHLQGKEIFLVMGCAGWHKSNNLKVPSNIEIIYLPPYPPELNPVERLWHYIKSNIIKNKVYETLEHLEEIICDFIKGRDRETIKSVCGFSY